MFRADLHCHTTFSDGSATPQELLHRAVEVGLSGLSITDHDTVSAYQYALPLAHSLGLLLGVGIEFSSFFRGHSVHILGYDFDLDSPDILSLCSRHQRRRERRNQKILEKLSRLRMTIREEELLDLCQNKTIGRPHIAQLMVNKGYVSSLKEAFDRYIGDHAPCFDAGEPISSEETIAAIHHAEGKAFLAHPHLIKHQTQVRELLTLPFDGIECYYARSQAHQEARFLKLAKERGLLVSGGSDFHGTIKEQIPLGCSWVDEACFHQIFHRL